jgi:hypothetical protein
MRHAYRVKSINLLYVNLITRIFRLHLRDKPRKDIMQPTNLFYELSNLCWVNYSAGQPYVWTLNNKDSVRDSNIKINQYTNPNLKESIFKTKPTHDIDVGTSSQPQP